MCIWICIAFPAGNMQGNCTKYKKQDFHCLAMYLSTYVEAVYQENIISLVREVHYSFSEFEPLQNLFGQFSLYINLIFFI